MCEEVATLFAFMKSLWLHFFFRLLVDVVVVVVSVLDLFGLTSGIMIMPGLCGNMMSCGVVKLVAVIEHCWVIIPPLVSLTDTLKS